MSTPPRRRRSGTPNPKPDGGGWLPTIAMGLGVVVAGLGIGALVAVLMQRSGGKPPSVPTPVAIVTSTAAPSAPPGRAPVAPATLIAQRSARPSPSPSPSAEPSDTASAEPSPSSTSPASPSPRPTPARTPREVRALAAVSPHAVAAVPGPAATVSAASTPAAAERTFAPQASPTAAEAAPAVTAAPSPAASAAVSTYDEHASAIVRRYVDALIRGDQKTAYAALGGTGGTLSEQAFIDPGARIVSLKVTRIDAANASVGCEIASAKGHYYATYHVTAATSGPYISEHDYIKV